MHRTRRVGRGARRRPWRWWGAAAYALVCVALWPVPVFGVLHAEASAVVAGVGFFVSGLAALAGLGRGVRLGPILRDALALLVVPAGLLTASLLWRPNCGYPLGLGLFVTFAVPSVTLAVAAAYALHASGLRWVRTAFVLGGLALALGSLAYDLGLHPQVYTYNPVFGGVLGPIYDEELAVRPGLFAAKALTLGLAAWLVCLGGWLSARRNGDGTRRRRRAIAGGVLSLGLAAGAVFAPQLGVVTTYATLQRALGGHLATAHVDLYFDPASLDAAAARRLGALHEYRYAQLREALGVEPAARVQSFVYPDADTKARLTGARQTSVAPVWLARPQVHLLEERVAGSLAHELAHAFAREFGGVLNASWSIGLVEGLAVAVEPPEGLPDPHAQVAAALRLAEAPGYDGVRSSGVGADAGALADAVVQTQTVAGFWGGRAAVSYTTMGSFVRWLLDAYGPEAVRAVYPSLDYASAFGVPLDSLAAGWARFVEAQPRDSLAEAVVAYRFSQPSLFEAACPHHVPRPVRLTRDAEEALAFDPRDPAPPDTARARRLLEAALAEAPAYTPALWLWGALRVAQGNPSAVIAKINEAQRVEVELDADPALVLRRADAVAALGDTARADTLYARADRLLPAYATSSRALLTLKRQATPAALRLAVQPYAPDEAARALDALDGPAAPALAAMQWARADDYERAYRAMRRFAPTDPALVRARRAWLADYAAAADRAAEAVAYATQAEAAYREAGASWLAAYWADRAAFFATLVPSP